MDLVEIQKMRGIIIQCASEYKLKRSHYTIDEKCFKHKSDFFSNDYLRISISKKSEHGFVSARTLMCNNDIISQKTKLIC